MIIWINGAFGVGKSHTAFELRRRTANSVVVDPEEIGYFLRKFLPDAHSWDDFQDIPSWRSMVRDTLVHCHASGQLVIVPMTIVKDEIFQFIMDGLKLAGCELRHFALVAGKATIERRLSRRGDRHAWNFQQVDRCVAALGRPHYSTQIDTESHDLDAVVEQIAQESGIPLVKPRLKGLAKRLAWLKATLGAIR